MFTQALCLLTLSSLLSAAAPVRNLIIDHDGGSDDFAAVAIAMLSKSVKVRAVTVCPADSYKAPATQITFALVNLLGGRDPRVAAGDDEGPNPFPAEWRADSHKIAKIKGLEQPDAQTSERLATGRSAPEEIAHLLSGRERFDILVTGPLTNIAAALRTNPEIAKNINRIYFMGGALDVGGNVERERGRPVAEWNVYNNPGAVNEVLRAHVPVTFVPLDATNKVPLTRAFMTALAGQGQYKISRLFTEIWGTVRGQIEHSNYERRYFFWDLLAAAVAVDPDMAKVRTRRVRVVERGAEIGRLVEDPAGFPAQIAVDPDPARLDQLVLRILRR